MKATLLDLWSSFIRLTFVEPLKQGRLHVTLWPAGLFPVAVLAGVGYAVAALLVVFAGPLRRVDGLLVSYETGVAFPRVSGTVLLAVVLLSFVILQTAALHTAWYVRIAALGLSALVVLPFAVGPHGWLSWVTVIGLVVFGLIRIRGRFAWWEMPVVAVIMWCGTLLPWLITPLSSFGLSMVPILLAGVLTSVTMVATPSLMTAGASLAQVAVLAAGAVSETLARDAGRRTWWVLCGVLVAWRLSETAAGFVSGARWTQVPSLASAAGHLALVALLGLGVLRWARALRPRSVVEVADEAGPSFLPLAAAMLWLPVLSVPIAVVNAVARTVGWTGVAGLTDPVAGLAQSYRALTSARALVAVLALVIAVRLARRGRVPLAVAVTAFAAGPLLDLLAVWTTLNVRSPEDALVHLAGWVALGCLVVFTLTRRLSTPSLVQLSSVLLLAGAYQYRTVVADPASSLLGFSGVAVLLFGLVWRALTDGAMANGDSRAFPRPARVLLFLGYALFAITVLAYTALTRTSGGQLDITPFGERGEEYFGTPLFMAAAWLLLAGAWVDARRRTRISVPAP